MKNIGESDDYHWKWGIFYYNPDDKRLFPPKRNQWMGWTVNFANWKSVLALAAMIAFFLTVLFLAKQF